jgi:hypothetical protein
METAAADWIRYVLGSLSSSVFFVAVASLYVRGGRQLQ